MGEARPHAGVAREPWRAAPALGDRGHRLRRAALLASSARSGWRLAAVADAQTPPPNAVPAGGKVVAGQSTIAQSGAAMTIVQGTQRSAINWNSYNIGANASVTYVQPNAQAISLNRVVGT